MITFDELKERFGPPLTVAPWGKCLVIQGAEFDPDWEAYLGDEGYRCHFGNLDGHPFTFVQLKKSVPSPKPEVSEKQQHAIVHWQPEETAFLIELWNQGLSIPDIVVKLAEKYPDRKGNAADMRLKRLKKAGKIQPRQKHTHGNEVKKMSEETQRKRGAHNLNGEPWTVPEDDLLVSLWNQEPHLRVSQVTAKFKEQFPKRSESAVTNRISALQHEPYNLIKPRLIMHKKSTDAKRILETSERKVEPADPDDNQVFMENEAVPDVKTEVLLPEAPEKIDEADVLVSIVKKFEILSEAYDANSKAYIELRGKLEDLSALLEKKFESLITLLVEDYAESEELEKVKKDLANHEHSEKSGKVVIPLEASS